jgi:RNA polymerase sigma-70 factor (ECF subfamily)
MMLDSPARPSPRLVDSSHRQLSDAEVASGLAAGEAWALGEVWRRFAPHVNLTARRALGSQSDADDVTQEVFSRVFWRAASLREPAALAGFVSAIATSRLQAHLRYRGDREWLSFREPETLANLGYATPEVEARELVRSFYALLDRLSPRDRQVFTLRRFESLTIEEIGSALGLSGSTVKRSFAHASRRLAQWVAGDPALAALLEQRSGEGRQ